MRMLITGGSGFLALNMALAFREHVDVCLLSHTRAVSLSGIESIQGTLDDVAALTRVLQEKKADVVIHTAGMANVDLCESKPDQARFANATLAGNVAKAALQTDVRMVHISTDHLFTGDRQNLNEQTEPSPINSYGTSKWEGEKRVQEVNPDALIVRTNFYGWGTPLKSSITDWVINNLRNDKTIQAFADIYFSPLLIDQLADAILHLSQKKASGIFNVVGDERISKYEFALRVAKVFQLDTSHIEKGSVKNGNITVQRPADMSLDNSRILEEMGAGFGGLDEGLKQLMEQEQKGRREELAGCIVDQ